MQRRWLGIFLVFLLFLIGGIALATPPRAAAHPADAYYQVSALTLTPDGISATWTITPGTLLAYVTWDSADTDDDGTVSDAEARVWAEPRIQQQYALRIGGQPVGWQIEAIEWPPDLVEFQLGNTPVKMRLSLPWPASVTGLYQVMLSNTFEAANSSNWFIVEATEGTQFYTPQQASGELIVGVVLPDVAPPTDSEPLRTEWDSGIPALAAGKVVAPPKPTSASTTLTRLVAERELTLPFILTALAISLGLGAIHALTPGHGKALVGAYLVGSRGTIKHALALGTIVTITHTGSVLALGVLTLVASEILLPKDVFPLLEAASGLLVVAMGLTIGYRRYRAWQSVRAARQRRAQPTPQPVAASASTTRTITINQPIQVNVYDDVLSPGDGTRTGINWRSLIGLGISGGLVPCTDAIAILVFAVTINRIVLGLSLIVAFSLGLAGILTGIGIAMVRSRRLFEGLNAFNTVMPALPLVSAIIVTGLGVGLTYNAVDSSDWFADDPDTLRFSADADQPFDLDTARLIYLDLDANSRFQLFMLALGRDPVTLTTEEFGVWDYQLTPDGSQLVFSAPRQYGGSDIWLSDVDGTNRRALLACPDLACSRPIWSPDGQRLVYERRNPAGEIVVSTLWWLDPVTGDTASVFQDQALASFNPAWSPDGQWLGYVAPDTANVQLYNLNDGRSVAIPTRTGALPVWNPASDVVLLTDVFQNAAGENFTHLMRYDLATETLIDLTQASTDLPAGDISAQWSPDGAWIAVVRRVYEGSNQGDQVWVMRADGTAARRLTDAANVIHGVPYWSPDGRYLVFQRYPLAGSDSGAGIWLLTVADGTIQPITPTGNWPNWIP